MSDEPRNPFLLPQGARQPATHAVPPATAATAPAANPGHYIAVPAPVESATHRIVRPDPSPSSTAARPADETRAAAPRGWVLLLADGARELLEGPLLVGRHPVAIPDRPEARIMPVVDAGKTVSKTHALLEPAPDGVLVRELYSTNGVAIDTPAGRRLLPPGGQGVAPLGATIMLGSFAIVVATG